MPTDDWDWGDKSIYALILLFWVGTLARTLLSEEHFNWRRFLGEILFACIGAICFYAFGLMQGMSMIQIIFFGSLSSIGGVRLLQWALKFIKRLETGDL